MTDLEGLKQAVIVGKRLDAVELTKQAVRKGVDPQELVNTILIPALNVVGDQFEKKEIFVPEMMIAAKTMQACMDVVKPLLQQEVNLHHGTVVIGTVLGDLHDIGKNLVRLLLESSGFKVVDLGVGVQPKSFVDAAGEHKADIVGLSSLLTTGDPHVLATVKAIKESDISSHVKTVCGGAALTRRFVEETCGADAYAKDAAEGVRKIKELLGITRR